MVEVLALRELRARKAGRRNGAASEVSSRNCAAVRGAGFRSAKTAATLALRNPGAGDYFRAVGLLNTSNA